MRNLGLKKENDYAYCRETLVLEERARAIYLSLGERLHAIREEQLYLPAWSSFDEYCMEFSDLSQGSVSKIISVYEKFVLGFGYAIEELVPAGGWTKLYEIGKQVETKKEADEFLAQAKVLSRDDLKKNLTEKRTGVSMDTCRHKNTYTVEICRDCGLKVTDDHQHA